MKERKEKEGRTVQLKVLPEKNRAFGDTGSVWKLIVEERVSESVVSIRKAERVEHFT